MTTQQDALATLTDYVQRSTHWQEGGATRHDALLALEILSKKDEKATRPEHGMNSGDLLAAMMRGHVGS